MESVLESDSSEEQLSTEDYSEFLFKASNFRFVKDNYFVNESHYRLKKRDFSFENFMFYALCFYAFGVIASILSVLLFFVTTDMIFHLNLAYTLSYPKLAAVWLTPFFVAGISSIFIVRNMEVLIDSSEYKEAINNREHIMKLVSTDARFSKILSAYSEVKKNDPNNSNAQTTIENEWENLIEQKILELKKHNKGNRIVERLQKELAEPSEKLGKLIKYSSTTGNIQDASMK